MKQKCFILSEMVHVTFNEIEHSIAYKNKNKKHKKYCLCI